MSDYTNPDVDNPYAEKVVSIFGGEATKYGTTDYEERQKFADTVLLNEAKALVQEDGMSSVLIVGLSHDGMPTLMYNHGTTEDPIAAIGRLEFVKKTILDRMAYQSQRHSVSDRGPNDDGPTTA